MKLLKSIIALTALTGVLFLSGCTTIDRQTVRDAFLDYDPATDYVYDAEKGRGVWKIDAKYLLDEVRELRDQ